MDFMLAPTASERTGERARASAVRRPLYACAFVSAVAIVVCSVANAQPSATDPPEVFPGVMSSTPPTTPAPNGSMSAAPAPPTPAAQPVPTPSATLTAPPVAPAPVVATQAPCPAEPKQEWLRDGFYLRMLTGFAYSSARGDGPAGSISVAGPGSGDIFLIGGSLAPGLVLALSLQSAGVSSEFKGGPYRDATITAGANQTEANDTATVGLSEIGAMLDWYPSRSSGLHLGLGGGFGVVALSNLADGSNLVGFNQVGTALVGYDWPIARTWAFGLGLWGSAATPAKLKHEKSGDDAGYELTPWTVCFSGSILYF